VETTPLSLNIYDRDFTMNSLAIPFGGNQIMDVTGRGVSDIKHKIVSSILPPYMSVPGDPLMITRAIRFSVKFGFGIEKQLWQAMKDNRGSLKSLSPERLAIEAYVLSKYPQSKRILVLLGLQDLLDDEIIKQGEEESEDG
jgi:tRNA nucleotidyltransferase/poly(A) polymerase